MDGWVPCGEMFVSEDWYHSYSNSGEFYRDRHCRGSSNFQPYFRRHANAALSDVIQGGDEDQKGLRFHDANRILYNGIHL